MQYLAVDLVEGQFEKKLAFGSCHFSEKQTRNTFHMIIHSTKLISVVRVKNPITI